ncbi:MAG: PqqD family protein [Bacteroidales bacterium]|nr:PqqD family protein [Bacteroidales bacterium]MBR5056224.1 PqqD family protein [Bacteroidales bacterium]
MRIKEGFKMRTLGNEFIIVGEGLAQVNFNKMISLNHTAAYLWQEVFGKEFTNADLVKLLLDKYEVTEEVATADVDNLVKKWIEAGLVEE